MALLFSLHITRAVGTSEHIIAGGLGPLLTLGPFLASGRFLVDPDLEAPCYTALIDRLGIELEPRPCH